MRKAFQRFTRSHSQTAQFLRFAAVGTKISLIDAGGVYLLPWLFGINLYLARAVSLGAALFVGYLLNRYFTFRRCRRGGFFRQMAGHYAVHLSGGLLNYGVFVLIVDHGQGIFGETLPPVLLPLLGLWIGGVVGLVFNFFFSRMFVFRNRPPQPDEAILPEPGLFPEQPEGEPSR